MTTGAVIMSASTVEFSRVCDTFARIKQAKPVVKRKLVRTFFDTVYTDRNYFSVMRLMLPSLDKERATYGLKEAVLGKFIVQALCLSKDSDDAKRLVNWRKGGASAGSNAGNFALLAAEILHRRQTAKSKGLKIEEVNDMLDRLAGAEKKSDEKSAVLADFISKTNAHEMRWIIMIILKDLKLGISEKVIFSEFHPDAEHVFNVKCDLKLVCEMLSDRKKRYNREDIEVGKTVRPQLAKRVPSVADAWKLFRGKEVVVECKFDGDRIQVHKDGNHIYFLSRKFNDHQQFKAGMAEVLIQNILPNKCILDGELLVWDNLRNRFTAFGGNREAAKAAKDGLETNSKLCYVVFDLLYNGSTSVMHLPLRERQKQLSKAVRPVKGRLELLHPGSDLNRQRGPDEPNWSMVAKSADEIQRFFKDTVESGEEGIILKDLDSNWEPDDRSGKWLKLKPDYINTGSDLDVLIIGGYYGSGKRGGLVGQFLLGIAERPKGSDYPRNFLSFCKVGTGMTEEERNRLVEKLSPYFRRNEKNSRPPPCYTVTNNAKERPDVWVVQPDKSVILQIKCDIRKIDTDVFAAPYGLRFPRVERIRYDKPWYDCLDVQTLQDMDSAGGGGRAVDLKGYGQSAKKSRPNKRLKKADAHPSSLVPSHMLVTDVTCIQPKTQIFSDLVFYFVNYPEDHTKETLHKLVAENGGSFSMNLNDAVTHAIAAERRGIKYQASCTHGDVIHYSWIIDCCKDASLLPIRPKYFLYLSTQTKQKMAADIDDYGDYYYVDIDTQDLSQLFETMFPSNMGVQPDELAHYKVEYSPSLEFSLFANHCVYFHKPIHSSNPDSQVVAEVTLKRQELEVSMLGGAVSETLNRNVTHMIVFTSSLQAIPFKTIFKSVAQEDREFLRSPNLKVLSHQWIDDCLLATVVIPPDEKHDLRGDANTKTCGSLEAEYSLSGGNYERPAEYADNAERRAKVGSENSCSVTGVEVQEKRKLSAKGEQKPASQANSVDVKADLETSRKDHVGTGESNTSKKVDIPRDLPKKRLVSVERPSRSRKPKRGVDADDVIPRKTQKVRDGGSKAKTKVEDESELPTRDNSAHADIANTGRAGLEGSGLDCKDEDVQSSPRDGFGGEYGAKEGPTQTRVKREAVETDDDPLNAIMGEMFPVFSRSQQVSSLPARHNSSLQLDDASFQASGSPLTSGLDVNKSSSRAPPGQQGRKLFEVDRNDGAAPVRTPPRKVSYKNLVKDLLNPQ